MTEVVLQTLMTHDANGLIGSGRHERNGERTTRRNGYPRRNSGVYRTCFADDPGLSAGQARILAVPGIGATVSIDDIKRGHYSVRALNPTGIVPLGPVLTSALAG